jgi:hypothetical protein
VTSTTGREGLVRTSKLSVTAPMVSCVANTACVDGNRRSQCPALHRRFSLEFRPGSTRRDRNGTGEALRPDVPLRGESLEVYIHFMGTRIRKLYSFPIDEDLAAGLKRVKAKEGVPEAEVIRRGLRRELERRGAIPKGGPKPAAAGGKGEMGRVQEKGRVRRQSRGGPPTNTG